MKTIYDLQQILENIAPPSLAAAWDNVGMLVEPLSPTEKAVEKVLLTIDLTDAVAEEARSWGADLVIAYHPPIFQPIRTLSVRPPVLRAALRCLQEGIFVYSPHTALDQCPGGVNDWLAEAVGPGTTSPVLSGPEEPGAARIRVLDQPVPLSGLAAHLSTALEIAEWRLIEAPSGPTMISRVAVCAGAGASTLRGSDADAWLTGEMSHHDQLAARENGVHVLLSEHTRTERGYLPLLAEKLRAHTDPELQIHISSGDQCPIRYWDNRP